MKKDIDLVRKGYLSIGEFMDAWRLIPRLIVAGYGFLTYHVYMWYMSLEPSFIEGCDIETLGQKCIIEAPTGMHTAALTAVGAFAAAIFAFYSASGRKWESGFKRWNHDEEEEKSGSSWRSRSQVLTEETCKCECTCSKCKPTD